MRPPPARPIRLSAPDAHDLDAERDRIDREIAAERARLATLERERAEVEERRARAAANRAHEIIR